MSGEVVGVIIGRIIGELLLLTIGVILCVVLVKGAVMRKLEDLQYVYQTLLLCL